MAFDLIVIDIPELGQRLQISRATYYKILLAGAYFDCGEFNGTNFPEQSRRVANEYVLTVPKVCDYLPYIITQQEKLKRMRRGWRSYRVRIIVPPVLPVRRHLLSNLGNRNIGCRNFHRTKT